MQGSSGETDKENRFMGRGERAEESEMYGESSMETYITICKIDSQWGICCTAKKLKQGLCINIERWNGEGDG